MDNIVDHEGLAAAAARRDGVFDTATLRRLGVGEQTARRQVANGVWRKLHNGIYMIAGAPITYRAQVHGALGAIPSAAASHETAVWIHKLRDEHAVRSDDGEPTRVVLSVEPGGPNRRSGVTVVQRWLPSHHVTIRSGWRVTTVERTLVDLGTMYSVTRVTSLVQDALLDRRTTRQRLCAVASELGGRGRRGSKRIRTVLDDLDVEIAETVLERRFLQLLRRHRLPTPIGQARFDWLGDRRCRVDFWYPEQALIIEVDGRSFHARSEAFEQDRARDLLAAAQGILVLRLSAAQLRDPGTPPLLNAALARRQN